MATTSHEEANVGTRSEGTTRSVAEGDGRREPRSSSAQIWHALDKASFAVLGYTTPSGEPRSSGVVYKAVGRRLHVAASGRVAMTVTVRRGGILSLVAPIPPATISFHATAIVHRADAPEVRPLLEELGSLLPTERRASSCLIEIVPEGEFLTYAVGVPLRKMRDPAAALARVSV
jgi:hypothetical protein